MSSLSLSLSLLRSVSPSLFSDLHENEIRDTYKIVVSSHPLDLSSLEVDSPYEYFGLRRQADFMPGSRGALDMNKMDKPISTAHEVYFLILYSSNNLFVGMVDISYMYTVMMQ